MHTHRVYNIILAHQLSKSDATFIDRNGSRSEVTRELLQVLAWNRYMYILPSVHPSIRSSIHPSVASKTSAFLPLQLSCSVFRLVWTSILKLCSLNSFFALAACSLTLVTSIVTMCTCLAMMTIILWYRLILSDAQITQSPLPFLP